MKPAHFFITHCATFDEPQEKNSAISDDEFDKLDILFNSVTHLETTGEKLNKIYMSVFLYQCFQETGYFIGIQTEGMYIYIIEISL